MKKTILILIISFSFGVFNLYDMAFADTYSKITPDNQFTIISYNVAGLPEGLSNGNPANYSGDIGRLLNQFDLCFLQEDFYYHGDIDDKADHPFDRGPGGGGLIGDGLGQFTYCQKNNWKRKAWNKCSGYYSNGSDCLTNKGFTYAEYEIADGVFIDIYNLHMDAGSSSGDWTAKKKQVKQLRDFVLSKSEGNAVIMVGDFNMSITRDAKAAEYMTLLKDALELTDLRFEIGGYSNDRVDKILYRSGEDVTLIPLSYHHERDDDPDIFIDENANKLSDHHPVYALFEWY
ncbi:MAG: hypothetical protein GY710_15110 [Desulfobacteraceae bacterium]|nr:hypothetical protein [Desulfobacteraceae bacterium]